jgi:hypothetical protein
MALWLVAPARTISSIIGRTLAANRLALAFKAALPSLAASAIPGLPKRCPRFLAACSAACALRDHLALVLSHSGKDMHRQLVGMRDINRHELNARFH